MEKVTAKSAARVTFGELYRIGHLPQEQADAYRAGLEEAARAMCSTCADSRFPAAEKIGNAWGHRAGDNYVHCYAHAILAIRAIAQPEPPPDPWDQKHTVSTKCTCPNQEDEDGAYCPLCGKEKSAPSAVKIGEPDEPQLIATMVYNHEKQTITRIPATGALLASEVPNAEEVEKMAYWIHGHTEWEFGIKQARRMVELTFAAKKAMHPISPAAEQVVEDGFGARRGREENEAYRGKVQASTPGQV